MIDKIFVYKTVYTDPYLNLAAEKYLMDNLGCGEAVLFLWQNFDTVVIGANQNPWYECRCERIKKDGVRLARRRSGGGAVYHDKGNLNFSFICSADDYSLERNLKIIASACQMAGVTAEFSGRNDLMTDGAKFSGNAFLTKSKISLHHGTLLINSDFEKMSEYLAPSQSKLQAKGVKSVRSRVINLSQLVKNLTPEKMSEYMTSAFEKEYGLCADIRKIPDDESIKKDAQFFQTDEYIYGKTFPFTAQCEGRCDLGNIRLMLSIEKGSIKTLSVYTDFMDESLAEKIQSVLTDCTLDEKEIAFSLGKVLDNDTAFQIAQIISEI